MSALPAKTSEGTRDLVEVAVPLHAGLRGLSLALDLAMGRHPGHAQATAALAVRVGRSLGLPDDDLADLAGAALLKDAGCPATRAEFVRAVGIDDVAFHREIFALEDYTPATFAGLLWKLHQGRDERIGARVVKWTRSLLGFKRYAEGYQREGKRSAGAACVAARLDCPAGTVDALAAAGEHWDGSGSPGLLAGDRIPIAGRIIAACQIALIWCEGDRPAAVAERLIRLRPGRFDPGVVRALARILRAAPPGAPRDWIDLLAAECEVVPVAPGQGQPLDAILLANTFAEIVDAKSAFTGSHSLRVATLAGAMAALDGQAFAAGTTVSEVILAGLLHDLGKLAVPTTILDKQGALASDEWATLRRHPVDSARVIGAVGPWRRIAHWAGAHHERLDGRGYALGRAGESIPPAGRLLAVADAFDAMVADRPYRDGMPVDEALRRIADGRGAQFDPVAADLLRAVVERDGAPVTPRPEREEVD